MCGFGTGSGGKFLEYLPVLTVCVQCGTQTEDRNTLPVLLLFPTGLPCAAFPEHILELTFDSSFCYACEATLHLVLWPSCYSE
jgi:hypothetical protein